MSLQLAKKYSEWNISRAPVGPGCSEDTLMIYFSIDWKKEFVL